MKLKATLSLFILIFLFLSCKSDGLIYPDNLYTDVEIRQLNKLIDEFDSIMIKNFNSESMESSYKQFSSHFRDNNNILLPNEFEDLSLKLERMEIFETFWLLNQMNSKYIINIDGKFIDHMKYISDNEEIIKVYLNSLTQAYDITPQMISLMTQEYENLDFSDKNIRLVFIFHYITLMNR